MICPKTLKEMIFGRLFSRTCNFLHELQTYPYIAGRENRWLIIGKTARKVFLTIVLGERPEQNTYGLITARPARREERSFYNEYRTQGGGENDEDKAS